MTTINRDRHTWTKTANAVQLSIALLMLQSCAESPHRAMNRLASPQDPAAVAESFQSAIDRARVVELKPGRKVRGELSHKDPILKLPVVAPPYASAEQSQNTHPTDVSELTLDDYVKSQFSDRRFAADRSVAPGWQTPAPPPLVHGRYTSTYYDAYQISVQQACTAEITIEAACSCIGFTKTIVQPVVWVADAIGLLLCESVTWVEVRSTRIKLKASFPEAGDYYVLIGANNMLPGTVVEYRNVTIGGGSYHDGNRMVFQRGYDVQLPIESSPVGAYSIRLRSLDDL